jgi:hypothetical protein
MLTYIENIEDDHISHMIWDTPNFSLIICIIVYVEYLQHTKFCDCNLN